MEKMKLAVSTLVHGRHQVLEKFFTIGDLPKYADLWFVAYTDQEDAQFIKKLFKANSIKGQLQLIKAGNDRIFAKAQAALNAAKAHQRKHEDIDLVLLTGSDDI